jgi:hypothetical protein
MQPAVSFSYVLQFPLSAVRLREYGEAESGFCVLPAGLTVAVRGRSSLAGLIDVTCDGQAYGVFLADLEERGTPAGELHTEHSGIRLRIPE